MRSISTASGTRPQQVTRAQFDAVVDFAYENPDFAESESNHQEIALHRTLRACMTTQQAGFLDFATALGAALLSGIRDELAYRFCLYGSLFLGGERDPHESFEKLKNIYDVRSKVVHGSPIKEKERTAANIAAADLACAVIRKSN